MDLNLKNKDEGITSSQECSLEGKNKGPWREAALPVLRYFWEEEPTPLRGHPFLWGRVGLGR